MRSLADALEKKGFTVTYLEYKKYPDPAHVFKWLAKKTEKVTVYDPTDEILERRLNKASKDTSIVYETLETPNFLTPTTVVRSFFSKKQKYLMNSFYVFQRKRLGILLESNGKPLGGRWSFDTENRKRLPQKMKIPSRVSFQENAYVSEAIRYVNKLFPQNPGKAEGFDYPIDHRQAQKLLSAFCEKRLEKFGAYEDAIAKDQSILFHSTLSAPLNIGLLSPKQVLESVLAKASSVPLESLEGFVRQVIGWREFVRAVYLLNGNTMRQKNFFHHTNDLPQTWYDASTGLEPVDETIKKVLDTSYCHHIERLMILGNVMFLMQISPNQVYGWFMDLFIDAYDWVMVPNVYGMSQFADGGSMTTKPYFSSSNYVLKMSDYSKNEWCKIWDALFYQFLEKHRVYLSKNPRLRMLVANLDRLSPERRKEMKMIIKDLYASR